MYCIPNFKVTFSCKVTITLIIILYLSNKKKKTNIHYNKDK